MIGIFERPSEHSEKTTNRTAVDLRYVIFAEIFVFINKATQKKGKALRVTLDRNIKNSKDDTVGSDNSTEDNQIVLFANNKEESEQLEKIFNKWVNCVEETSKPIISKPNS